MGGLDFLVVDDDSALQTFISDGVRLAGHQVTVASNGPEALAQLTERRFDAVVLDRMLPGLDGLSVLRQMRANACTTPVLMLTALGQLDDRIEGLTAGADDYLVKPFAREELHARLQAIVRRSTPKEPSGLLVAGELELDLLRHRVRRNGRDVPLQRREFGLLVELVRHCDQVVTRAMLLETVWGYTFEPQTNIVDSHVSRLRTKLSVGDEVDPIVTVRGTGYMLRGMA